MPDTTQFRIGADAIGTDGVCGEVSRVVVDPVARAVTHLVVEPKHRQGLARLVPLDLVDATTGEIHLRCTIAEFGKLDHAEETQFLPGSSGYGDYATGQAFSWPYFSLVTDLGLGNTVLPVTEDTIPMGEVAVRRDEQVHATDGEIGHLHGFVIDPADHRLTHLLLDEGHLWGKKQVAIPISAVSSVDGAVRLTVSKHDVAALPAVDLATPGDRR